MLTQRLDLLFEHLLYNKCRFTPVLDGRCCRTIGRLVVSLSASEGYCLCREKETKAKSKLKIEKERNAHI